MIIPPKKQITVGKPVLNLYNRIQDWAQTDPDRMAIQWNGIGISYAQWSRGLRNVKQDLQARGLRPGSTAVVAVLSLLDAWAVVLSLRQLGLHTVAVMGIQEAIALDLQDVGCVLVDPHKAHGVELASQTWPHATIIRIDERYCLSRIDVSPTETLGEELPVHPGDHVLYTSGTTGRYKKLVQKNQFEMAHAQVRCEAYGLRAERDWFVGNLGLWTAVGYRFPLGAWYVGGAVVFDQREHWAQHFLESPCDTMLVPDAAVALLRHAPQQARPGDWALWVTAGFLSSARAQQMLSRLTRRLFINYGSTELCGPALTCRVDDLDEMHWLHVPSRRLLQIVDDDGQACPVGQEGLLRVRLDPLDATEYVHDPDASQKVFKDGFFYPGDMAVRREDGRIRVLGRNSDVLNVQGRKLAVAPLEQALIDRLGLSAVCLFNELDQGGADVIWVVLETATPPNQAHVAWLRTQLSGFERIRMICCPDFPRTKTGTQKVNRVALRQMVAELRP